MGFRGQPGVAHITASLVYWPARGHIDPSHCEGTWEAAAVRQGAKGTVTSRPCCPQVPPPQLWVLKLLLTLSRNN